MGVRSDGPDRSARALYRSSGVRFHGHRLDADPSGTVAGLPRRSLRAIKGLDMSTEIRVPTLGESVTEATIGQWFKQVGDAVAADEPIVELETDKVTIEVPAPVAGVLEAIAAQPGETVDVGALLGAIGGAGAGASAAPAAAAPAPAKAEVPAANAAGPEPVKPAAGTAMPPAPAAQKLIKETGVDAAEIEGSGKRGQVLKEDVVAAASKPAAAPAAEAPAAKPAEAPKAP